MKAGGTFVDVETGKPIGTQSAGGCRFDLKKHDFKAIVYR